jgi:hypothetical protein
MNKNGIFIIFLLFWTVLAAYSQQLYDDENDFIFENLYDHHDRGSIIRPELMITGYIGRKNNVRIPPRIQGLPIKIICPGVFREKRLTGVTIPDGIEVIEDWAFFGNQLTDVVIPGSVSHIGEHAFENNQLIRIIFPNSVSFIGRWAFTNNQLTYVEFLSDNTYIGFEAFKENKIANAILPNRQSWLGGGIFEHNNLTSIIIPNTIYDIASFTFTDNQITTITIGSNVIFNYYGDPPGAKIFDNNFDDFYVRNGRKAGTYIYNNSRWVLQTWNL